MENEKKYFNSQRYGFGMIDETKNYAHNFYNRYKPCYLEFIKKELVAKEDETNDKAYEYMYTYKLLHCKGKRFVNIPDHKPYISEHELIDQYVIYYKDD